MGKRIVAGFFALMMIGSLIAPGFISAADEKQEEPELIPEVVIIEDEPVPVEVEIVDDEYFIQSPDIQDDPHEGEFDYEESLIFDTAPQPVEHLADEYDMQLLSQVMWGEYRGYNDIQRIAVAECIFNRLKSSQFPNTLHEIILAKGQFVGYSKKNPILEDFHDLAVEIWNIYHMKEDGYKVEWIVPERFLYFHSEKVDGEWINVYTTRWDYWNGGEQLIIK